MDVRIKDGGSAYVNVLHGEGHTRGTQVVVRAACLPFADADGMLHPGFQFRQNGTPALGGAPVHSVLTEAFRLPETSRSFAGVILSGGLRLAALQDNADRVLTAEELAAFPGRFVLIGA